MNSDAAGIAMLLSASKVLGKSPKKLTREWDSYTSLSASEHDAAMHESVKYIRSKIKIIALARLM